MTEDDFYDETEFFPCPHCSGFGQIDCHCGGDLCVCENFGEAVCPICHGEGEVSEERYDRYEESQRRGREFIGDLMVKIAEGQS